MHESKGDNRADGCGQKYQGDFKRIHEKAPAKTECPQGLGAMPTNLVNKPRPLG
jgi:hypothetical protein